MTHYSIKEAAGFRKASDYVLKGIFNTYRKDPAFRKFYGLDNIINPQRGRTRAILRAMAKDNKELLDRLYHKGPDAPVSRRSLRQAEFSKFKEQLRSRYLMEQTHPALSKKMLYMFGPSNWPNFNPFKLDSPLPGSGVITGGFDPLILSLVKLQGRAPRSWTQVLGHEVGHSILRDMNSRDTGAALVQPFRRSVLKDYRTKLTPAQRHAALKYAVRSGNKKSLVYSLDPSGFFSHPEKRVADLFKDHPEFDERAADAIAMSVGQGNQSINRAIANHFNRYYRNVKGPVGWRARHLLRAE